MKRLLLHVCCAPDATVGYERLGTEHEVDGLFYNPNIHPAEEYARRKDALDRLVHATGARYVEGPVDRRPWADAVAGLEGQPERGRRCEACIRLRLMETARRAKAGGYDAFAAVLSVSPKKDAGMVNRIGEEAGQAHGVRYVPTDLKKRDGFLRSLELCRQYGIYRQDYCGCEFSFRRPRGEGGGG